METALIPGIIEDLPNAAYHADNSAVSSTDLKLIGRSIDHWLAAQHTDTPAKRVGSLVHTALLEPERVDIDYGFAFDEAAARDEAVEAGALATTKDITAALKAAGVKKYSGKKRDELIAMLDDNGVPYSMVDDIVDQARSQHAAELGDRQPVSEHDLERAMRIANTAREHPHVRRLLANGHAERTYVWQDARTGIPCKCRPDWITSDGAWIVDVKTCRDARIGPFQRAVENYLYHLSAAFYLDGVEAVTGQRPEGFIWLAIESDEDVVGIQTYLADLASIEDGQTRYADALYRLQQYRDDPFTWTGYPPVLQQLGIRPWAQYRPNPTH